MSIFETKWKAHLANPHRLAILLVGGHPGSGKTTWALARQEEDPEKILVLDDPCMHKSIWGTFCPGKHHTVIIADPFIALGSASYNEKIVREKLHLSDHQSIWWSHFLFPDEPDTVAHRARKGGKPLSDRMKGRFVVSPQTIWLPFGF